MKTGWSEAGKREIRTNLVKAIREIINKHYPDATVLGVYTVNGIEAIFVWVADVPQAHAPVTEALIAELHANGVYWSIAWLKRED